MPGPMRSMVAGLVCAALLALPSPVHAVEPSIWYRTGEGCPDGASFLQRLDRRSVRARLAAVGDPVDFVVTLGVSGDRSSGRLERQTSSGTIAIREVADASCDAVADALAFSLALTLDPATQEPSTTLSAQTPVPNEAQPRAPGAPHSAKDLAAGSEPAAAVPVRSAVPASGASAVRSAPLPAPHSEQRSATDDQEAALRAGATVAAADLFEGPWLVGAGPFVEGEAAGSFAVPRATLRAVLLGGMRPDADASARAWLAAARIEACPLTLGGSTASVRPCAAMDVGAVGASAGGVSDTALWSAVAAHARFRFEPGRIGVEAQVGGIIPLTRYEVTAAGSGATLERTSTLGFAAGVGVSARLE